MALKVTSLSIKNEFNNIQTNWLKNLKGERMTVDIAFTVQTSVKFFQGVESTDNSLKLQYAPASFSTGDYIQAEFDCFFEFYNGDTINIADVIWPANNGNYTIVEKVDNRTLRLNATFTNAISSDAVIKVVDVVDKFKMRYNFIENDEIINFNSKVDGNLQEIEASGVVQGATSPSVNFVFNGNKSWQTGSATLTPDGYDSSGYPKFKISAVMTLTPFIIADQWDDFIAGIYPDYFFNFKCLKFVYRIEASYVGRSPYINQSYQDDLTLGDSGTYNEQFNNTPTNFTLDSFSMTDSSAVAITKLKASTEEQSFTAVIKNTVDIPFDTTTKFLVQFYISPQTEAEYKNNGNTLQENFKHDRALQTVGAAAINGDQYGVSGRQVLKTIQGTLNSSSQITVTGKISIGQALSDYLKTLNNPRYVLEVITGKSE